MATSRRLSRQAVRPRLELSQAPAPGASGRRRPLVVVALATREDDVPASLLVELERAGVVVYTTHGSGGCLRAATALGPDTIYLDSRLPQRLQRQLRAHPRSAGAVLRPLPDGGASGERI